ncbi:MAG: S-layer homology domain-containing protein [Clostridia bacterium]|nr:S-layer homology domain-containing protein [Clostridia bacterium]
MRKIISILLTLAFVFGSMCIASAEVIMLPDFLITKEGEITAYYGDEWVVVPEKVDDIPVTKIGEQVFFDLGIADAYLPEGLSVIGKSAFEGSNITSVDIPSTVKIIADRAFANCKKLLTVFATFDEDTVIGEDAFFGTGHLIFYLNCDVDTKAIERKLLVAKGDRNFEVEIRHTSSEYDEEGNVKCTACGFMEQYLWEGLPFTDVPQDAWYYDYVMSAYANKIINGKSETIFDPDASMTCGEAVKIAASIHLIFNDTGLSTPEGPWYQQYVDYCYDNGIIEKSVILDWESPITRAQMAYIFANCDPFDDWYVDINDVPITDIPDVSSATPFAYQILALYNKGIAVGDESMSFHPNDSIKRCEAAAIVSRIMDWKERIELPKG